MKKAVLLAVACGMAVLSPCAVSAQTGIRVPVTSTLQPAEPAAESPDKPVEQTSETMRPRLSAKDVTGKVELPAESVCDSLLRVYGSRSDYDPFDMPLSLPPSFFMPVIYDTYIFENPLKVGENLYSGEPHMRWLEDYEVLSRQERDLRRHLFINHPEVVRYTLSSLPEAPQKYTAVVNPADFTISISGDLPQPVAAPTITGEKVQKRHWIRTFTASLQFSQAYVSPNWYQGGNNNLNALANIFYNVKLNQEYHPNLLFETTAQYKLGINNAPDDEIHSYNVSEDVLQVNTTFGVKAAHRWYYSFNAQFKTQMVNSYKSNSTTLTSAFLSPGQLTAGVGMTYNYQNKPKTFSFDASIAPVSYNMTTVVNHKVDATAYGIEAGRTTKNSFGSSAELKLFWRICYNIRFNSRLFAFSDYDSFQCDWENTLSMDINRFLTTQIYAHARYDTRTPRVEDANWHKLQVKEIFSIGFSYKFASI